MRKIMRAAALALALFISTSASALELVRSGPNINTVLGPGAAVTDLAIARWDGVTGTLLQNSPVTMGDNGLLTWTGTGQAITATSYQIGKDNSATNLLAYNAPSGSSHLFSIAGSPYLGIGNIANRSFHFDHPAISGITASTERSEIKYSLSSTKTWETGALSEQKEVVFTQPVYAAVGASTFSLVATHAIDGGPIASTNMTLGISAASTIGSSSGWSSTADTAVSNVIFYPAIANGTGATSGLYGQIIASRLSGTVSLGNQTATTSDVASLLLTDVIFESSTLVRTVTDASMINITGMPSANSSNVLFTNGPYGIGVSPSTSIYQQATNSPVAIKVKSGMITLNNNTNITDLESAGVNIGVLTFARTGANTPTVAAASGLYVKGAPTAAAGVTLTNSYAIWVDSGTVRLDGDVNGGGDITSSKTTSIGWSIVAGANTACNTTCTFACVHGWDTAAGEVAVDCADATADKCLCAGAN